MFGAWATKPTLQLIGFITASVVVVGGAALAIVHVQDQTGTTVGASVPAGSVKAGSTTSASNGSAGTSASAQAGAAGATAGGSASGQAKVPATTSLLPSVPAPKSLLTTLPTITLPTLTLPSVSGPTVKATIAPSLPALLPTIPAVPLLPNLGIPVPVVALGILGLPYASGSFRSWSRNPRRHQALLLRYRRDRHLQAHHRSFNRKHEHVDELLGQCQPAAADLHAQLVHRGLLNQPLRRHAGLKVQATIAGLITTLSIDSQGKSVRASLCD